MPAGGERRRVLARRHDQAGLRDLCAEPVWLELRLLRMYDQLACLCYFTPSIVNASVSCSPCLLPHGFASARRSAFSRYGRAAIRPSECTARQLAQRSSPPAFIGVPHHTVPPSILPSRVHLHLDIAIFRAHLHKRTSPRSFPRDSFFSFSWDHCWRAPESISASISSSLRRHWRRVPFDRARTRQGRNKDREPPAIGTLTLRTASLSRRTVCSLTCPARG